MSAKHEQVAKPSISHKWEIYLTPFPQISETILEEGRGDLKSQRPWETVSSGPARVTVLMSSQRLWRSAQEPHEINPVNSPERKSKDLISPN